MKKQCQWLSGNDTKIVMVCLSPDQEKWKKYIRTNGLKCINLADLSGHATFRKDYNIVGTPLIFVLDKEKKIIGKSERLQYLLPLLR